MTKFLTTNIFFKDNTQAVMLKVILSLMPAIVYKVYALGWLALFSLITLVISAILTEKLVSKALNIKDSISDFSSIITAVLLFLALNANMNIFIYFMASFVAIALGKLVYGGLAKNIFNPAMVGWCFVMVSFPQFMTKNIDYQASLDFVSAFKAFFNSYSIDSFTQATPLIRYHHIHNRTAIEVQAILIINMLILAGGLYLVFKKIVNLVFPLFLSLGVIFALYIFNYDLVESCQIFFLYGPLILTGFYIITDPVSSPSVKKSQMIYSFSIGFISILIARFGAYPIGVAFAVLFANSFNFILDSILYRRVK